VKFVVLSSSSLKSIQTHLRTLASIAKFLNDRTVREESGRGEIGQRNIVDFSRPFAKISRHSRGAAESSNFSLDVKDNAPPAAHLASGDRARDPPVHVKRTHTQKLTLSVFHLWESVG
jgi:hypothetical protein